MPINVIDEKTGEVIAGPGKKKKKKPTEWIKRKPTDVRKGLIDRFSGGVEGKPHSSEEGRRASAGRKFSRVVARSTNKAGGRAEYGIGSIVKGARKIISKALKPKGVFKPKPVPKVVTDKPTGWSPKGEYTKADDKKITSMLKKLGDEIKAQPLPPKLKETMKKLQKAYPHKKASGGRIGLKKGSVHKPGTHSWWLLQQSKPRRSKKASGGRIGLKDGGSPHTIDRQRPPRKKYIQSGKGGGWIPKSEGIKRPKYKSGGRIGLKHGGSVGAAIRGHGAEIK